MVKNGGTRDFLCLSLLISFKGENSKETIRHLLPHVSGPSSTCYAWYTRTVCKFFCSFNMQICIERQKHEMRHEDSELREKRQIASQFTAEKVARGMDG